MAKTTGIPGGHGPADPRGGMNNHPDYDVVSTFGNGTTCDQNGNETIMPWQVSYDDTVDPKFPG